MVFSLIEQNTLPVRLQSWRFLFTAILCLFGSTTLSQNDCPTISVRSGYPNIVNPTCGEANGSIELVASGQGTIRYRINGGAFQNNGRFEGLVPADYTIGIIDATGCIEDIFIPLQDPTNFSYIGADVTPTNCTGNVGRIVVNATGIGLMYRLGRGEFQSSNVFSGLSSGSKRVTIRSASGCELFKNINVPDNGVRISRIVTTEVNCPANDGTITVTAESPNGNIQYSLDDTTWQSSPVFTGLAEGRYRVYVRDGGGCKRSRVVEIINTIEIEVDTESAICAQPTGRAEISVIPSASYEYSLDEATWQSSPIFDGLSTGAYTVFIRDPSTGCEGSLEFSIEEANTIANITTITTPSECVEPTGTIDISVTGDSIEFSFDNGVTWSTESFYDNMPAGSYPILIRDANECEANTVAVVQELNDIDIHSIVSSVSDCAAATGSITVRASGTNLTYSLDGVNFQENPEFLNVASGGYTVTVANSLGCAKEQDIFVDQNSDIVVTSIQIVGASDACTNDGEIIVTATGGGVEYSLDGNNYQDEGHFRELYPGQYIIYLRSNIGCEIETGTIEILADFRIIDVTSEASTCFSANGIITINAFGPDLDFSLDGVNFQSSEVFDNVEAGEYEVFVRSEDNCILSRNVEVFNNGDVTIDVLDVQPTLCNEDNGSVSLSASSKGADEILYSMDGINFDETADFFDLPAGQHTVYVRDNFGCTNEVEFTVDASTAVEAVANPKNTICAEMNGQIALEVTGGTGNYTFEILEDGRIYTQPFVNDLDTGSYTILITDENLCSTEVTAIVERDCTPGVPNAITVNGNGVNDRMVFLYYTSRYITNYQIFDRWGREVYREVNFESTEQDKFWNGIQQDGSVLPGTYTYIIDYLDEHDEAQRLTSMVTVIR